MEEIKELISLGVLIEPEALERIKTLNKNDFRKVILRAKEDRPLMLSRDLVERYIKTNEFKIVKKFEKKEKISINELTSSINEKYNTLRDILLKKIELRDIVSINKASSGNATIIGMINGIEEKNDNIIMEAEDPTGTMKCVASKDSLSKISLDDVVSLSGTMRNNTLFVNEVNFPDVPIRQAIFLNHDVKVAFISKYNEEMNIDSDFLFVYSCESKETIREKFKKSQIFFLSKIDTPLIVEIGDVKIMFLIDYDPLIALKKRYVRIDKSDFVVDTVPDIIFVNRKMNTNYKSISILGENIEINLKNREIKEINT